MAKRNRSKLGATKDGERRSNRKAGRRSDRRESLGFDPTLLGLGALVLLPPFFFLPGLSDAFRLPKTLLCETLALVSLGLLCLRLGDRSPRELARRLVRLPALHAVLPILVLAVLGLAFTSYPVHVRQALPSLFVGAVSLVGWAWLVDDRERRLLLRLAALPAIALAGLVILQYHGLSTPFEFEGRITERIALTSLAGGAFDLAAYLVLPILVALAAAHGAPTSTWRRLWLGMALVCAYAVVITSTFTAIIALVAGLVVLSLHLLPRRRLGALVAALVVVGVVVSAVGPLAPRVQKKAQAVATGDPNRVLTGRLDGWRAALYMAENHPLTGVGLGAYRPAYGPARHALRLEGVEFYRGQHQAYFVNAHSDPLEALGELGVPGLLAVLWAGALAVRGCRWQLLASSGTHGAGERALLPAGLLALGLMGLVYFPFHLALVAYPWLIFLGGPLSASAPTSPTGDPELPKAGEGAA